MPEHKFMGDEERKCYSFVFAVLDATIAQYSKGILDCGHETDGCRVGAIKDSEGRYFLYCFECFDKYSKEHNLSEEIENVSKPIIVKASTIH